MSATRVGALVRLCSSSDLNEISHAFTAQRFDRSDQINQNSRGVIVSPRGAGQTKQQAISLRCRKIRQKRPKTATAKLALCVRRYGGSLVEPQKWQPLLLTNSQAQHQSKDWWSQTGSNRRPHACKARALPTELWPHWVNCEWSIVNENFHSPFTTSPFTSCVVGPGRLELPTSRLSGVRSNHLSYGPSGSRQRFRQPGSAERTLTRE
jgi:hypothetical protein